MLVHGSHVAKHGSSKVKAESAWLRVADSTMCKMNITPFYTKQSTVQVLFCLNNLLNLLGYITLTYNNTVLI